MVPICETLSHLDKSISQWRLYVLCLLVAQVTDAAGTVVASVKMKDLRFVTGLCVSVCD